MADTSIEWTSKSWNPTTGCDKVSEGCGLPRWNGDDTGGCYAMAMAKRLKAMGQPKYQNDGDPKTSGPGFLPTEHPDALTIPLTWTKPQRVFVNSMSDLFHDRISDAFIAKVWAVMAATPQHTYQILTKRHARMRSFLRDECRCGSGHPPGAHLMSAMSWAATKHNPEWIPGLEHDAVHAATRGMTWGKVLPNVWVGTSVETQRWADIRVPALLDTPAAVRFLSCEPLLGPVDLEKWLTWSDGSLRISEDGIGAIDWVIVGGESGKNARPMHPDWARSLRRQCEQAGVPYFYKQHGEWAPIGPQYGDSDEVDEAHMDAVTIEVHDRKKVVELERDGHIADGYQPADPRTWLMARVGKHVAGRVLDGHTHDDFPAVAT